MTCEMILAGSQLSPCHPWSLLCADARAVTAVMLVPAFTLQRTLAALKEAKLSWVEESWVGGAEAAGEYKEVSGWT